MFSTVGVGLGLGLLFDRLIFALLLKCMGLPVVIQSTFQIEAVLNTLLGLAFSFWPHSLVEFFPPLALQFPPPYAAKKAGEKKGRFLLVQTLLGLGLLGIAFYIALTAERPVAAVQGFFIAVILVILATYLFIQRRLYYLLKISQRSEILLLQAREFYICLQLNSSDAKNAAGLCDH